MDDIEYKKMNTVDCLSNSMRADPSNLEYDEATVKRIIAAVRKVEKNKAKTVGKAVVKIGCDTSELQAALTEAIAKIEEAKAAATLADKADIEALEKKYDHLVAALHKFFAGPVQDEIDKLAARMAELEEYTELIARRVARIPDPLPEIRN